MDIWILQPPTETPSPTPTPAWGAPTPLPAPAAAPWSLDMGPVNAELAVGVEHGVNLYQLANQDGAIDALLGMVCLIVLFLAIRDLRDGANKLLDL